MSGEIQIEFGVKGTSVRTVKGQEWLVVYWNLYCKSSNISFNQWTLSFVQTSTFSIIFTTNHMIRSDIFRFITVPLFVTYTVLQVNFSLLVLDGPQPPTPPPPSSMWGSFTTFKPHPLTYTFLLLSSVLLTTRDPILHPPSLPFFCGTRGTVFSETSTFTISSPGSTMTLPSTCGRGGSRGTREVARGVTSGHVDTPTHLWRPLSSFSFRWTTVTQSE